MTTEISSANRIIAAVGKHVITEDALTCGNEGVGVDETADGGIVITGLQIIESGILGADIATRSFWALSPLVFETENQGRFVKLLQRNSCGYLSRRCGMERFVVPTAQTQSSPVGHLLPQLMHDYGWYCHHKPKH